MFRTAAVLLFLPLVVACGRDALTTPRDEPKSARLEPPTTSVAMPARAPSPAGDVLTSSSVSTLFAEGWDLKLAHVVGATVLYDPHLLGVIRVVGNDLQKLGTTSDLRGLGLRLIEVAGEWPNSVWALVQFDDKRRVLYRWSGTAWESAGLIDERSTREVRVLPGKSGSAWAVLIGKTQQDGYQLIPLPAVGQGFVPVAWNAPAVIRARFALPVTPNILVVTRTGNLLGFGELTNTSARTGGLAIGSWQGDISTSESGILPLESIGGFGFSQLCHGLDATAYVLGRRHADTKGSSYAARWDGKQLSAPERLFATDLSAGVEACTISPQGALLVALEKSGEHWLAQRDGASDVLRIALPTLQPLATLPRFEKTAGTWQTVAENVPAEKPQTYVVTELQISTSEECWLSGYRLIGASAAVTPGLPHEGLRRSVVLRVGKTAGPAAPIDWADAAGNALQFMPVVEEARSGLPLPRAPAAAAPAAPAAPPSPLRKPQSDRELTPATSKCQSAFVALYALAPGAPKDYDYPGLREALGANDDLERALFVEIEHQRGRLFGVLVDDYALGQRLVSYLREKVKDSAPQLLCGKLSVIRTVAIGRRK